MLRLEIELAVRFIDLFALFDNAIGDLPDPIKPVLIKKLVNDEVAFSKNASRWRSSSTLGFVAMTSCLFIAAIPILVCILLDISGTMIDISGIFFQLYSLTFQ